MLNCLLIILTSADLNGYKHIQTVYFLSANHSLNSSCKRHPKAEWNRTVHCFINSRCWITIWRVNIWRVLSYDHAHMVWNAIFRAAIETQQEKTETAPGGYFSFCMIFDVWSIWINTAEQGTDPFSKQDWLKFVETEFFKIQYTTNHVFKVMFSYKKYWNLYVLSRVSLADSMCFMIMPWKVESSNASWRLWKSSTSTKRRFLQKIQMDSNVRARCYRHLIFTNW